MRHRVVNPKDDGTSQVGGPPLALRLDPHRAEAAAGFDYFIIGVPDHATVDELAAHLDALGEPHGGVHRAGFGWILPPARPPTGHEVRFYTAEHHTSADLDDVSGSMNLLNSAGSARGWERTTTTGSG